MGRSYTDAGWAPLAQRRPTVRFGVDNRLLRGIKTELLSLNIGAVHGYRHVDSNTCNTTELGQAAWPKPPLKLKDTWAIRIRLQGDHRTRELALFNLAIDSKLRGCDLVGLRVHDVVAEQTEL